MDFPQLVTRVSDSRSMGHKFNPSPVVELDHEIISTATDSRRVVVSYKQKYMHEVLVNRLVKLA